MTTIPRQDGFLGNPIAQALLELDAAKERLLGAAEFARTQALRPDDHYVILRFGQFRARLHAAEGLVGRATHLARSECADSNKSAVSVSLSEARAFVHDLISEISGQLAAWGGPSYETHAQRAHGDGVDIADHRSYYEVGAYYLKDIAPPPLNL